MRVMALFSTSFFAKYLRVGEDGPGQGHLCHTDTFLVLLLFFHENMWVLIRSPSMFCQSSNECQQLCFLGELTLVMLNKLRAMPTSNYQPVRLLDLHF